MPDVDEFCVIRRLVSQSALIKKLIFMLMLLVTQMCLTFVK